MARKEENLSWNDVDVDTLSAANKKLYKAYKEASAITTERRKAFDEGFEKAIRSIDDVITDDQSLRINHKFGKLSFAISDESPNKARSRSTKFSFQ